MNRPKKLKLYQHEKIQEMPVAATGKPGKWYRHVFLELLLGCKNGKQYYRLQTPALYWY